MTALGKDLVGNTKNRMDDWVNKSSGKKWKPDVFVHPFIPQSLTAINQSPATIIRTPQIEGTDFVKYISNFAGSHFLSVVARLPSSAPRTYSYVDLDALSPSNYDQYFGEALALDREARIPEIRSYDLFGVQLDLRDYQKQVYSFAVPGVRDNTPFVSVGDSIIVRQLLIDPATNLPRGMGAWLAPGGGFGRGEQAPGFTGYEVHAIIIGVDRLKEVIFIRAYGMVDAGACFCNVSFTIQDHLIENARRALADIASEIDSKDQGVLQANNLITNSVHSNSLTPSGKPITYKQNTSNPTHTWLQQILFPTEANSCFQTSLPSVTFSQGWFDPKLNYEQKKAVDAVQKRKFGDFCYLINGPPGTGKTKTMCEIVAQLAKDPGFSGSILLCAPSNPAADTLALRLRHLFDPKSMLRLNHFSRTFAEVPQELLPYCFVESDLFSLPPMPKMMGFKLVITTCQAADLLVQARITNRDLISLQEELSAIINPSPQKTSPPLHWTALLIDEAAQATEPETLIPLTVVAPPAAYPRQSPTFVMAGDQHQLNPRTYSHATTLHVSLFERLSANSVYAAHPLARKNLHKNINNVRMPRPPFINLIRNYRSHPAILAIPSSLFYANTLIPEAVQTNSLQSWSGWRGRRWPVLFACNAGIDMCEDICGNGGGWYNVREAQVAIGHAQDLLTKTLMNKESDICIMSPFQAQVNLLRKLARHSRLWNINIGPMEAFQGLESRFVIVCTTRARRRFLEEDKLRGIGVVNEPKKFNVAITRAKEGLIVLGNPWVLSTDPQWVAFMRFCERNSLIAFETDKMAKPQDYEGANVNEWWSSIRNHQAANGLPVTIKGLEAGLLYREREREAGSTAGKRIMTGAESFEDALYRTGLEAQQTVENFDSFAELEYSENGQRSFDLGFKQKEQPTPSSLA